MVTRIESRNIEQTAISPNKLSSNLYVTLTSTGNQSDAIITNAYIIYNSSLVSINTISYANSTYHLSNATAVPTNGGYVVITGNNFTTGTQVLIGQTPATSISFINSSTLHVQTPSKNVGTYEMYVVTSIGATAVKPIAIRYRESPLWVTVDTFTKAGNSNVVGSLIATSNTSSLTYSNTTILPSGLTLLANGYYYGNVTLQGANNWSTSIGVQVIDTENLTNTRTFNITFSNSSAVFDISPSVSGKSTWNMPTDGDLVLSSSGTYTLIPSFTFSAKVKCWGAGGGNYQGIGGAGGAANASVEFAEGTTYTLIVGATGTNGDADEGSGGGGGTGIHNGTTHVIIAGGGGGGHIQTGTVGTLANGGGTGGAGGGSSGLTGWGDQNGAGGGGGGTQSAGGAAAATSRSAGADAGGSPGPTSGGNGGRGAGTILSTRAGGTGYGNGGAGSSAPGDTGGSGGGGGYYGGGGGGHGGWGGGTGGGGSGYINPSLTTGGVLYAGTGGTPGNSSDADRGTAGNSTISGKIVIKNIT